MLNGLNGQSFTQGFLLSISLLLLFEFYCQTLLIPKVEYKYKFELNCKPETVPFQQH